MLLVALLVASFFENVLSVRRFGNVEKMIWARSKIGDKDVSSDEWNDDGFGRKLDEREYGGRVCLSGYVLKGIKCVPK